MDAKLKRQAEAILEEFGLKPKSTLEQVYKQNVQGRSLPFPVSDDNSDEVLSLAVRRNALADEF